MRGLAQLPGVGSKLAQTLSESGFRNLREVAEAKLEMLVKVPGIGSKKAEKIQIVAKEVAKEPKIRHKAARAQRHKE